jgi:hypothetical protein
MPDVQEVFRLATQEVRPEPGFVDRQQDTHRRRIRNRRVGAFLVVGALGIALAVAILLQARSEPNERTPADEPDPVSSTQLVARRFLGAFGSFDADRAITYLSEDASISEMTAAMGVGDPDGSLSEFRLLVSLLEAMRYRQILGPCEELDSSDSGTRLRCALEFELLGSDRMGRGPFGGSFFSLTVRDGRIVRASQVFETEEFSPRMWEPFAAWVSSNYPEDAAVMYRDATNNAVRLTQESIRLWEQRLDEWVRVVTGSYAPGGTEGPLWGRFSLDVDGVAFSFRVPPPGATGWEPFGTISINKSIVGPQGAEAIIFWTTYPDGDNADLCTDVLSPSVGPGVADLADAVSTAPGTELVAGPSEVTVGGRPAKHVVLTIREDAGCDPGYFFSWQDMWWGAFWPQTDVGVTVRVWIIDVGGTLLFIEAETNEDATTALVQEIEQIVGSIRFD